MKKSLLLLLFCLSLLFALTACGGFDVDTDGELFLGTYTHQAEAGGGSPS